MIGTAVQQYQILEQLGEGGMSRCRSRAKRVNATSSLPAQVYRMEQAGIPRPQASHIETTLECEASHGGRCGL